MIFVTSIFIEINTAAVEVSKNC